MNDSDSRPEPGRQSAILVCLEFAVFAGVYLADWTHHVYISKVPYLFVLAWVSLRLRGLRWLDVGFAWFQNWHTTVALGVLAGVGIEVIELFCTQPLLAGVFHEMPNLSAFDRVQGNIKWLDVRHRTLCGRSQPTALGMPRLETVRPVRSPLLRQIHLTQQRFEARVAIEWRKRRVCFDHQ
jgi:hypothetical protein